MVDKTVVGKKIFELRKKKGITQDYLAKQINITPQAISKWENGVTLIVQSAIMKPVESH